MQSLPEVDAPHGFESFWEKPGIQAFLHTQIRRKDDISNSIRKPLPKPHTVMPFQSGVFNTPVGAAAPAPIFPGDAYEITFTAAPAVTPGSGACFSFATMFIQSNDLFYAFSPEGLALFDANGTPCTGDVTSELRLYDAGTEINGGWARLRSTQL